MNIPDELRQFIDGNIESLEQLEILRVLGELTTKQWTLADLAREAQIPSAALTGHVTALESRGLLQTKTDNAQVVCQHGPRPPVDTMAGALLKFYNEHPVTLIRFMYARAADPLKAFADSFRLRKES